MTTKLVLNFSPQGITEGFCNDMSNSELGEDGKRTNRQLKDAEFGNKDISNLQELMDVLPNIDVSDVMEIPKVFQCDEQTLPCDHTTKFRFRSCHRV